MHVQHGNERQLETPWAETAGCVVAAIDTSSETGLTRDEVKRRRRQYGLNRMRRNRRRRAIEVFLYQFKSIIVLILVGAALLSFAFGHAVDGLAISVAVLVNTLIGFVMEMRATRSMESLRRMEQIRAKVLRDGQVQEVAADGLVPGDIVLLEAGDIVSADMRLLEANKARADESALTGESVPIDKNTDPTPHDAQLSGRSNMLFKGTALTAGSCKGVVTHTGMDTALGRISSLVQEAQDETTPLEKRLERLGQRLLWITLGILVVVALAGIVRGKDVILMIQTAVALAVAAIPEGLPIVATVAMARGMLRMARRNALVNRLAAVETLGSTTVICTDKTGTLTENRMTVKRIVLDQSEFSIDEDSGNSSVFFRDHESVEPGAHPALISLLQAGVLCNNASLGAEADGPAVGDPLEVALLEAGARAGIERRRLIQQYPEEREESFDPSVKMMATFHQDDARYRVTVKGAPEAVLDACSSVQCDEDSHDLTSEDRQHWKDRNLRLAEQGLRTLALAHKTSESVDAAPYNDLTFLGLVAMADPPRAAVAEAISRCRSAGIRVVMATGDHTATAKAIAAAVGLSDDQDEAIEGKHILPVDELSEQQREHLIHASIFSRVSPEQKLHLIDLHKTAGAIVAMTGDGVNDAPALKKADIGVAMGQRGTQVARDAADMILKDDAFSSIVVAVEQGRIIFRNIRKFILYLLSGNASEILVVFLASLLNWPLPILPLQILFLNIVNDVFPALALGVGEGETDTMKRPPRDPREPVLPVVYWWAIVGYGLLIALPVLAGFRLATAAFGLSEENAVTVSFLVLAFARVWHIFNMRNPESHLLHNEITANRYVWGALVLCGVLLAAVAYIPGLSAVLSLSGPRPAEWGLICVLSLIPLVVGQAIKALRRFTFSRDDG